MKLADKYPRPSTPEPPECPEQPTDRPYTSEEIAMVHAHNEWVRAFRKHRVALAIDKLNERRERFNDGAEESGVETIAIILGRAWLEDQERNPFDLFGLL